MINFNVSFITSILAICLTSCAFLSCGSSQKIVETTNCGQSNHFDWLLGKWIRVNGEEGLTTYEEWYREGKNYSGSGFTLSENDTVWREDFTFDVSAKELSISMPEELNSTTFVLTEQSTSYFLCENPENDFPKKIKYAKLEGGLKATISGGGPEIDFVFERYRP